MSLLEECDFFLPPPLLQPPPKPPVVSPRVLSVLFFLIPSSCHVEEVVTPVEPVNTAPKPIIDDQELAKREAEANRQAELLARQEAELQAANDAKKLKQKAAEEAEIAAQQKTEKEQEPQVQKEPVQEQSPVVEKEPVKPVVEVKDTSEEDLKSIRARRAIAEAEALAIRQMMSTPSKVLKAPPPPAPPAPVADDKKGTLHKPVKTETAEDKKKALLLSLIHI